MMKCRSEAFRAYAAAVNFGCWPTPYICKKWCHWLVFSSLVVTWKAEAKQTRLHAIVAIFCKHIICVKRVPGPVSVWHWCLPGIRHNGVHQFLHCNSLRTNAPCDRLHWGSRKIEFGVCGIPSCRWHRVHTTHRPLVLRTWHDKAIQWYSYTPWYEQKSKPASRLELNRHVDAKAASNCGLIRSILLAIRKPRHHSINADCLWTQCIHCIFVCIICPPGQGRRSWHVMSNQQFNVPECVRLHKRSTAHENSSIIARWILEAIHYSFSTTVTESTNGCRSCPRSTGSNSGIFHTSSNLWTLGLFHAEGTCHNTSHIFTLFKIKNLFIHNFCWLRELSGTWVLI